MNYYIHHIGDYLSATAHLTLLEHGVYCRMIDVYYIKESPLPCDREQLYRLIGARTGEERAAVDNILLEFFKETPEGWRQSRCDYEIEKCANGQQGRECRAANESARVKRHREERAALFAALREAGKHAPWNIGIEPLRELVTGTTTQPLPATAPATPATASPTPQHPNTPIPPYPPAFELSEAVVEWGKKNGFEDLQTYVEPFNDYLLSSGKVYKDLNAAFRGAVREDWFNKRRRTGPNQAATPMERRRTCQHINPVSKTACTAVWTVENKGKFYCSKHYKEIIYD